MVRGQILCAFGEDLKPAFVLPRRSVQALAGLWFELEFAWQEMLVVVSG